MLDSTTLQHLDIRIKVPSYNRTALEPHIVHLGLGHFHRSHFCYYLHQLLEQGVTNWGIEEIDLVPSHTAEAAEKQDYLYTLCSKDPEGNREMTVIGCILGYTKGWEDKRKAIDLMKRPQTQLITLTITEKGYCYDNQTQSLDWQHPHLQHDLLDPRDPQSAVGYLALALSERCLQTKQKLTIASCDNIPSNGQVLRRCLLQYCDRVFPSVVPWIEQYVAFPLSMVDRITPNTKAEDIQFVEREYGLRDDWLVVSEHFLQWVIEPEGLEGLPPFEKAGALVTKDVEAFETMKIRLLNGSHSALAYPALLLGYTFVDEALSDPLLRSFIRDCYMREVGETLLPIPGYDFEVYKDRLIERFSNPYCSDTLLRLAQDGSKKFGYSLVPALKTALERGLPHKAMVCALAFWAHFIDRCPSLVDDQSVQALVDAVSLVTRDAQPFFRLIGFDCGKYEDVVMLFNQELILVQTLGVGPVLARYK
ncbi:MAG TPA: mannitol dehydrogenase family protein [Sphaerochaeta sp.]|nr:mannitol dehydrogenase family protein [Sphaerochaeta sp.]